MNLEKLKNNKKYIILKDGNNIGLMLGVITAIVVVAVLATSKMWLPDDRAVMTKNNNTKLFFSLAEVEVKEYYVDYNTQLAELHLTETKMSDKEEYNIEYTVASDDMDSLPFNVIKGAVKKDTPDSVRSTQDIIVQFAIPKNFYYVTVGINQPNTALQSVMMDYRKFEIAEIIEKGENYLMNLETERSKLDELKTELTTQQTTLKSYDDELKTINAMTVEEKQKQEARANELNSLITKQKEAVKNAQKIYDEQKTKVNQITDTEKVE